ncbi:YqeB family protein [Aeromicrobium alkaliterrae]|uniref:YqeB PH domain-containing protein n=1 Tax=Aeromicrobium alkaliterrae TaxID=302168 RepID=A0ABP4W6D6_9ACTN
MSAEPREHAYLGSNREDTVWTYVLLGGGGVLVLVLAPLLAAWLADVPFIPFSEPLRWVGDFDEPWQWAVRGIVGLVAGLVLAAVTLESEYRLEVHDDRVVVVHGKDRRTLTRDQVVGVHRDRKKVVIDGTQGRRLFEETVEAKRDAVRAAFVDRGWPYESE